MRAGVEAIDAGTAVVARLAQERVAVSAGHDMRLEDRDLEPGIGEQRRSDQAADPCADHRHVDRIVIARARRSSAPASDSPRPWRSGA